VGAREAVACTFLGFIIRNPIVTPAAINNKIKTPMKAGFILPFAEIFYCHFYIGK
jgi:hypothetical protein